MLRYLLSVALLFSFFTGHVYADDGYGRVAKIDIEIKRISPTETIDPNTIRAKMKTKEGAIFSQTDFDTDLKLLSQDYDRVEPEIEYNNNQVFITLNIWAKPTIKNIAWQGNELITSKKLQKELGIKPGAIYDRFAFSEAFHKIKALYVQKGFFEADLDYTVTPLPETNEVDITVTINEGRAGRIKRVCFNGFTKDEERKLNEMIYTKKYNLFMSWYTNTGTFQQEALDQDQLTIVHFLQNEGYADAKVDIQISEAETENRINVLVTADRGEMYYFGNLTFSGNTIFTNEQIVYQFKICEGSPFSPDALRDTVRALTLLYGTNGYIESTINFQPSLREDAPVYDVHFTITEGDQFKVGLIKIFGNSHTQTRVILHECLLVPGQVFDSRKLMSTEQRLQNIQYFKNVNVYPVKSQDEKLLGSNYRDVHIEVEEANTGNISAFFGFSTLDSLFGGVELLERNFNYKGFANLFTDGPSALRGGGEYLNLRAMIGTKNSTLSLRWVKPYFLDTNWIVGFDLEKSNNRIVSKDYDIKTWGIKPHATYPINAYLNYTAYYRLRESNTTVNGDVSNNPQADLEAKRGGWVSAVGSSLLYSRLDNVHRPRDGFRSDLSLEYAFLWPFDDYTFFSVNYINTLYIPVSSRGVLKFRCDARFITPLRGSKKGDGLSKIDSLPLSERYFLGGETTVRGYRGFSIGPTLSGTNDPAGGISSFLVSEEYMHSLFKKVDGFVFFDAGSVTDERFDIGRMYASYGLGLRVELFNQIPIVFGMGFPINPANDTDVRRFFVSLGGRF
ncbi:MAG: outer membrane protein assembly factor BamA [Parachlamydiales bacterium]|nr:outer membrane protein assembly factor BamA [Parachlamydiales bacterium]